MGIIQRSLDWGLKGNVDRVKAPEEGGWNLKTVNIRELLKSTPLNPWVVLFLGTSQLLGVLALTQPFKLSYLPIMVAMYLWLGFSVTFYLHRYLTHKGFETIGLIKFIGALGAVTGLSGDPVGWVGDHRHHHRASDQENDLHSPRHLGFWNAHWGWIFHTLTDFSAKTRELAKDVRVYWYARLFEKPVFMILPHLLTAYAFYHFMGFAGMVWCFYFPILLMNHVTWCINSVCHIPRLGYKNFEIDDDSVNVPVMGVLALGEGYHNNHHANGRRAAHGLHWYEFDPTKYLIWILERFRLVWNVAW